MSKRSIAARFAAVILTAGISVSIMPAVTASAVWVKSSSGYSYKDDDSGEKLTGWQTINGSKYCFDTNGIAYTGFKKINGSYYYFNSAKMGRMVTGWATIGKSKYYFGTDGKMRAGKMLKINGDTYYFQKNGKMATGKLKINGKVYDFGTDGKLVTSSSSSASSSSLYAPMNGLKWGMSADDIIDTLGLKTGEYVSSGPMLMVLKDDNSSSLADYYLCLEGYGLAMAGECRISTSENRSALKSYFDGWKLENTLTEDGATSYIYSNNGVFAEFVYNDKSCITMIFSPSITEDITSGDIDSYDITDMIGL